EQEVQIIFGSNYTQYTFKIERPEGDGLLLENYIYKMFNDGTEYEYIAAYPVIITENGVSYDAANATISLLDEATNLSKPNCRNAGQGCELELVSETWHYECINIPCDDGDHDFGDDSCECGISVD